MSKYSAVKTFCATTSGAREMLGERLTAWLNNHPDVEVVEAVVTQSSDHAHHCVSIVVMFNTKEKS